MSDIYPQSREMQTTVFWRRHRSIFFSFHLQHMGKQDDHLETYNRVSEVVCLPRSIEKHGNGHFITVAAEQSSVLYPIPANHANKLFRALILESEWARWKKAIDGIFVAKKWRAATPQPGLELDNFKPKLNSESSIASPGWTITFEAIWVYWKRKSKPIKWHQYVAS